MSKSKLPANHQWAIGDKPPILRPHSEVKHMILKSYLEAYVKTLTSNILQDRLNLRLVDGFAGGGLYIDSRNNEECLGSPLLMLETMKKANEQAQESRKKKFVLDVEYYFIESHRGHFDYLRNELVSRGYFPLEEYKIHLLNSKFENIVYDLIAQFQSGQHRRTIFVLDQFGWSDVPFATIRDILAKVKNSEVILTFAVDALINFMSDSEATKKAFERLGLEFPLENLKVIKSDRAWRRVIQTKMHSLIPSLCGAKYYTPFFIHSPTENRDYWLIHLSSHHRARDVMTSIHWQKTNKCRHYGRAGLHMLGYDPKDDESITKQLSLPMFGFDKDAEIRSAAELMNDLPEAIHEYTDGVTFDKFYSTIANETPATSEQIARVIQQLSKEGDLFIKGEDRKTSKRHRLPQKKDIIVPRKVRRLF